MGLYIVNKYTEMLGGTVTVETDPGKGSTFIVAVPIEPKGNPNGTIEDRKISEQKLPD